MRTRGEAPQRFDKRPCISFFRPYPARIKALAHLFETGPRPAANHDRGRRRIWRRFAVCTCLGLCVSVLSGCSLLGGLISAALPFAGVKLYFACIPERTLIDTPAGPKAIEKVEAGDWVVGFRGQAVRVLQKHAYLESTNTTFLKMTFASGAAVDLCGMHRIDGIRAREVRIGQEVAGDRVVKIELRTGESRSYDLLTEDAGYRINGIPVNSMIEEMQTAAAAGRPPRN